MDKRLITRIDLERAGSTGIIVRSWFQGWRQPDAGTPDMEDYIESGSIPALLAEYERQGFTVEMAHASVGRALRGEITRIDFIHNDSDWIIKKFPFGWTAKTRPLLSETKPADFDMESALAWCESRGWTVYRWDGGARAWKGAPKPVRDRASILAMRRKALESHVHYTMDFAFYF